MDELKFVKTCEAFPEQYDVFFGDVKVAYIRYRGNYLTCECPDCCDELVLEKSTDYPCGGILPDDKRESILKECEVKILEWIKRQEE